MFLTRVNHNFFKTPSSQRHRLYFSSCLEFFKSHAPSDGYVVSYREGNWQAKGNVYLILIPTNLLSQCKIRAHVTSNMGGGGWGVDMDPPKVINEC